MVHDFKVDTALLATISHSIHVRVYLPTFVYLLW